MHSRTGEGNPPRRAACGKRIAGRWWNGEAERGKSVAATGLTGDTAAYIEDLLTKAAERELEQEEAVVRALPPAVAAMAAVMAFTALILREALLAPMQAGSSWTVAFLLFGTRPAWWCRPSC